MAILVKMTVIVVTFSAPAWSVIPKLSSTWSEAAGLAPVLTNLAINADAWVWVEVAPAAEYQEIEAEPEILRVPPISCLSRSPNVVTSKVSCDAVKLHVVTAVSYTHLTLPTIYSV